jgi:tubulin epsilon
MKHADCTLPIDNQALINIVNEAEVLKTKLKDNRTEEPLGNNIIAHLLSDLTCSMRFEGVLNVDFNEITMNMVPYPDLHFLVSSLAPLYSII